MSIGARSVICDAGREGRRHDQVPASAQAAARRQRPSTQTSPAGASAYGPAASVARCRQVACAGADSSAANRRPPQRSASCSAATARLPPHGSPTSFAGGRVCALRRWPVPRLAVDCRLADWSRGCSAASLPVGLASVPCPSSAGERLAGFWLGIAPATGSAAADLAWLSASPASVGRCNRRIVGGRLGCVPARGMPSARLGARLVVVAVAAQPVRSARRRRAALLLQPVADLAEGDCVRRATGPSRRSAGDARQGGSPCR